MKIGLVTLHEHNYGSALQCFASQYYLESKGYSVEVLNLQQERRFIKRYSKRLLELLSLCMLNPRSCGKIVKVFMSQRNGSLRISNDSEERICDFNKKYIRNTFYSKRGIRKIGRDDSYCAFFSGSDQVWNVGRVDFYNQYFLRFAPLAKRIGWAASFGGKKVADYNISRFSKYLKEFNSISVREPSAVEIVKELTGRNVDNLADPVILVSADRWRDLAETNGIKCRFPERYVLFFFLDKPSDYAISFLNKINQETGLHVLTFGYKQENVSTHFDGGPFEFLSIINGAEYVLTDSFHVVVFSLLFHRRFYAFDRQYVHKQTQSSRITDLLEVTNLINRFNPNALDDSIPDYKASDEFFLKKKQAFDKYMMKVENLLFKNKRI